MKTFFPNSFSVSQIVKPGSSNFLPCTLCNNAFLWQFERFFEYLQKVVLFDFFPDHSKAHFLLENLSQLTKENTFGLPAPTHACHF